jgi:hypothetical protein
MTKTKRIYNNLIRWATWHPYKQFRCFSRCKCHDKNNFSERGFSWSGKKTLKKEMDKLQKG